MGWIIGPILAGSFVLSETGKANTSNAALFMPYLIVAGMVALMVVVFRLVPVPEIRREGRVAAAEGDRRRGRPLHHEYHFLLGIASQFLYCAAQIGIFSFFINYLKDDHYVPALPGWLAGLLPDSMKFSHPSDGLHLQKTAQACFSRWPSDFLLRDAFQGAPLCDIFRRTGPWASTR